MDEPEKFRSKLRDLYEKLSPKEIKKDLKKDKRSTLAIGILIGLANALGFGYTIYSSNPGAALLTYIGPFSLGIPVVLYKTLQYLERSDMAKEYLKKRGGYIPE